jgi:hypothetical protein
MLWRLEKLGYMETVPLFDSHDRLAWGWRITEVGCYVLERLRATKKDP